MKKSLLTALAATALVAFSGMLSAEEISGRVSAINEEAQTLTLDNGMTFKLSEDASVEGISAGQEVRVTYEEQDGAKVATEIGRPEN